MLLTVSTCLKNAQLEGTCMHFSAYCAHNNTHYTAVCTCIRAKYHHMQAQMHTEHTSRSLSNICTCITTSPVNHDQMLFVTEAKQRSLLLPSKFAFLPEQAPTLKTQNEVNVRVKRDVQWPFFFLFLNSSPLIFVHNVFGNLESNSFCS